MRLILVLSVVALSTALAVGGRLAGTSSDSPGGGDHRQEFLAALKKNPAEIDAYVLAGVKRCAPPATGPALRDPALLDLTAKTLRRGLVITAEGRSKKESSQQFMEWILAETKDLSLGQQENFMLVMNKAINNSDFMLCTLTHVRDAMQQTTALDSDAWDLRG